MSWQRGRPHSRASIQNAAREGSCRRLLSLEPEQSEGSSLTGTAKEDWVAKGEPW